MSSLGHGDDSNDVETSFTTTLFTTNIHCSSCVNYIEDVIQQTSFIHLVYSKNINVVSGEITIKHDRRLPVAALCEDIAEAAFEIKCATTVDEHDKITSETRFESRSDSLLKDTTERLCSSLSLSPVIRPGANIKTASYVSKQKRHVENCMACKSKGQFNASKHKLFTYANQEGQRGHKSTSSKRINYESEDRQPEEKYSSQWSTTSHLDETGEELNHSPLGIGIVDPQQQSQLSTEFSNISESLGMWTCELSIAGMTCSACTNALKVCLERVPQVQDVKINLLTHSASVRFYGEESISENIVCEIGDAGFEASIHELSVESNATTPRDNSSALDSDTVADEALDIGKPADVVEVKLSISGMTCSACANSISQSLTDVPFVREAIVNLLTNSAHVTLEGKHNLPKVINAVKDVGFDCSLESTTRIQLNQHAPDSSAPTSTNRRIQMIIRGFFCDQCPAKLLNKLERYHKDTIAVYQAPSLKNPIIGLSYKPDQQKDFTIRKVVNAVAMADPNHFSVEIYHPPSIEERSRIVQTRERSRLMRRLILSFITVIPTFLMGILFMDLVPEYNSVRQYLMERIWVGIVPRVQWALLFLSTPVYFFAADIFHLRAIKEIRALWHPRSRVAILRRFTKFGSMNLLVSAGTTVAYVSSIALLITDATMNSQGANVAPKSSSTYFDTVVFLTFFILIGRFLEAFSKSKAGDAVAMLGSLRPNSAVLISRSGDNVSIDADMIETGDHLLVRHGQSPAADGCLLSDEGKFDESSLTGESRLVRKRSGDRIFAGTINRGPPVTIRVTELVGSSMLDQIISIVREGQAIRAPVERFADVVTAYFVPAVTSLALLTFAIWVSLGYAGAIDPRYLQNEQGGWIFYSLEFAIAVFVVACPCGIGLAAPTALFVGGGLAAKHGILVRGGGQAFQDAGRLDAVVFDKTGTLTEGGNMKVTNLDIYGDLELNTQAIALARALETASAHPIAVAIAERAGKELSQALRGDDITLVGSNGVSEIPGRGMEGIFQTTLGTLKAKIGSPSFIANLLDGGRLPSLISQRVSTWEHETKSVVLLATLAEGSEGWEVRAAFAVEDAIRPSALSTIEVLRTKGLQVYMLTGDNWSTALAVASRVGIEAGNVFASVSPTEKADKIEWLQQNLRQVKRDGGNRDLESQTDRLERSRWASTRQVPTSHGLGSEEGGESYFRKARIAFVGDGINDAPALTRADISISPGSGSPIALTSSSFILMSPSLAAIPKLLEISTRVFRRVKFNFFWALTYNAVLVPVAAGILFKVRHDGFKLGPVWGSLAMALSSVSVVVSSLLLRWENR